MDKLQWFKFTPSDWMMGKIQKCSPATRGMFVNLCCLYWNKECDLSFEDAEIEVDEEHLSTLIKKKIVILDGENIRISFLDEQMEGILETSDKRRDAANKRWKKGNANAMQINASASNNDANAMQNDADKSKIRVEKKRKDKTRTEIPPFEDFKNHAYSKLTDLGKKNLQAYDYAIKAKYEAWIENDWHDGKGNKILGWKSKLTNTVGFLVPTQTNETRTFTFNNPIL